LAAGSQESPPDGATRRFARALLDALRRAITTRRGYCSSDIDHASRVVTLHSPDEHGFYSKMLEEALA
jgi:hypothetical protein